MNENIQIPNKLTVNKKIKMPSPYEGGCSYRDCIYLFLKWESCDYAQLLWLNPLIVPWAYYYGASCRSILYRKKTTLPLCFLQEMHTVSKFLGIWAKFSDSALFCYLMQNDICLINLSKLCWWWNNMIFFLSQTLVAIASYFDHDSARTPIVHNVSSFHNWTRFHFIKCNVCFWRNFMLVYQLPSWFWQFLFNTKFVCQTNSFSDYCLK